MTLSFRLSALPLSWPDILPQPWPTTGATGITSWVPESCRLLASRKILPSEQFLPWLMSSSRQTTVLQSCFVYTFLSSFQFPTLLDYRTIGNHLEWSHLLATLYDQQARKKNHVAKSLWLFRHPLSREGIQKPLALLFLLHPWLPLPWCLQSLLS